MYAIGNLVVCVVSLFSIYAIFVSKRVDLYWEVEKWPGAGLIGIGYVALVTCILWKFDKTNHKQINQIEQKICALLLGFVAVWTEYVESISILHKVDVGRSYSIKGCR